MGEAWIVEFTCAFRSDFYHFGARTLDESLSSAVLSPWVFHGNDVPIPQRYTEAVGRRSSKWCRQDTHY